MKLYEIRDPIHGFIVLNDWERELIGHPAFQRLRRIRQLGWTDVVYPGAMHTRFEHSLGVMHVATRMFDEIQTRRRPLLESELQYTEAGLERDRVLVRLAALLHDVGHAPFSHAAEALMTKSSDTQKPYRHEDYSAAIVTHLMRDVIEGHPLNQNYQIKAEDIADFLKGSPRLGRSLLWRSLISSQLDADRADYLLRDSYHIGVEYGRYDLNRLLVTMTVTVDSEGAPVLAVEDGGMHAAEGLILARYMMFTQVYFHHTRRAYDQHLADAMRQLLAARQSNNKSPACAVFPPPTGLENVQQYVDWTDWRVLGMVDDGMAGDHGIILKQRRHHRMVYQTPEAPQQADLDLVVQISDALGESIGFIDKAESSWYRFGSTDIPILMSPGSARENLTCLSELSSVVRGLKAVSQRRIYVPYDRKDEARKTVDGLCKIKGT